MDLGKVKIVEQFTANCLKVGEGSVRIDPPITLQPGWWVISTDDEGGNVTFLRLEEGENK
jgi:hypothetical protein